MIVFKIILNMVVRIVVTLLEDVIAKNLPTVQYVFDRLIALSTVVVYV